MAAAQGNRGLTRYLNWSPQRHRDALPLRIDAVSRLFLVKLERFLDPRALGAPDLPEFVVDHPHGREVIERRSELSTEQIAMQAVDGPHSPRLTGTSSNWRRWKSV